LEAFLAAAKIATALWTVFPTFNLGTQIAILWKPSIVWIVWILDVAMVHDGKYSLNSYHDTEWV
jgi:hypothetical protein